MRRALDAVYLRCNRAHAPRNEQLVLQMRSNAPVHRVPGALQLLEFLGNVALTIGKRLLADVVLWDCVQHWYLADFQIITKYAIVSDLQLP